MDDNTIICRCSDITLKELRELISKGYTSVEEIKRINRAGMGPCQGRTCENLILREIAAFKGVDISELKISTRRPIVKGITLGQIASAGGDSLE